MYSTMRPTRLTVPTTHSYSTDVVWTGNRGSGTSSYRAYDRAHEIRSPGKAALFCSSDPKFLGDRGLYNPEELLVASLSSCHMLWYLHLAADNGIVVVDYRDAATGTMVETADGGGKFAEVTLHPTVTARAPVDEALAARLHDRAHDLCFIANSVAFPVGCEPRLVVISADATPPTPQADGA
jgi:organic hydroperoxide reductase OsmC/OhrA